MAAMAFENYKNYAFDARKFGEFFARRVSKTLRQQAWYWKGLSLAWTAGPVTYLALQGGHYISYGKFAKPEVFVYFAGYTAISGLIAAVVQFVRMVFIHPKEEEAEKQLLEALDRLFMLYFSVRNEYIKQYPEEERPIIATWWSCRTAASDLNVLQEAIRDVTGDDTLAHAIKRIEFYRKQGFADLMQREYLRYQSDIDAFTHSFAPNFPALAELIQQRFKGYVPNIYDGQPRPQGFIERLIVAEEEERRALATADDIIAVVHLTLEMLLGRQIIALHPRFRGHKRLEDAKEKLDALLSDFRLIRRKRNSRMWALAMDLDIHQDGSMVQARGASSDELRGLLIQTIEESGSKHIGRRRYQEIVTLNDQLKRLWKKLSDYERSYNKLWRKEGKKLQERLSATHDLSKRKSVLHIEENEITLTHKQKIAVSRKVHQALDDIVIRKRNLLGLKETKEGLSPLEMDDYQILAIELLDILDDELNISEPEEQLAVEGSREADFGCIEPDHAAQTKIGWGHVMVEVVQHDRIQIAHRLADALVRYLNISLGETIMDYLVEHYGASREYLEQLQREDGSKITMASDRLQKEVLQLPSWGSLTKQKNGWMNIS